MQKNRKSHKMIFLPVRGIWVFITLFLYSLTGITGCSDNTTVQIPEEFIHDFIAKHETMADRSLIYYYVKEEQAEVAKKVDTVVRINAAKGILASLESASFDFSGLRVELVDQKSEYINDEPVLFAKVAIKGNYTMKFRETSKTVAANEIIILQMARNEWKVTETHNPWG